MVDRKSLALGAGVSVSLFILTLVLTTSSSPSTGGVPVVVPARDSAPRVARAAGTKGSWESRLAREDELLLEQAVAAGCDKERAAKLRDLLAAKTARRAEILAARDADKIDDAAMEDAAFAARQQFEEKLRGLLRPEEIEALDPAAARARILEEEKKR